MESREQAEVWQKVADLRPRPGAHVGIYAHRYRGANWYILHDRANGRHLRINESAHAFVDLLDGTRSVYEAHRAVAQTLNEIDALTILAQLTELHLLQTGAPADVDAYLENYRRSKRQRFRRAAMNPLAIRIPLFDPERMLTRLNRALGPLFSRAGLGVWAAVVGLAGVLALANHQSLGAAVTPEILAPANIAVLLLLYCLIKFVHEIAHGLAVKAWGGEVHEMGITLLLLMPIPHVDASAAWAFPEKYRRIAVGAAGILAEVFIAAVALFVWLAVEPGTIKNVAFDVMLIAAVSTLLFNANPLLKFDGYHVLQDWLEIPNLYTRSAKYYSYLVQKHLFDLDGARTPQTARGEAKWFLAYGLASFCYRVFISFSIALFLSEKYLFAGIVLAIWAMSMQFLLPIVRAVRFLAAAPILAGRRTRAALVTSGALLTAVLLLTFVPVPLSTNTTGVVWVSDQAQVFSETDGFVEEVFAPSGSVVEAGEPILRLSAPLLEARLDVLEGKQRELRLRAAAERIDARVKYNITMEELAVVESELSLLRGQASGLLVRAAAAGTLAYRSEHGLEGQHLKQGSPIGYLISPQNLIVKSIVSQQDIGLVRRGVEAVELRIVDRPGRTLDAGILRETPAANSRLPSAALGVAGGGKVAVSQEDATGLTAADDYFLLEMSLPDGEDVAGLGSRAYVRIDHGSEPLARQWIRNVRQLLLSRLSL